MRTSWSGAENSSGVAEVNQTAQANGLHARRFRATVLRRCPYRRSIASSRRN